MSDSTAAGFAFAVSAESPTTTIKGEKMAITAVTPDLIARLTPILAQIGLDIKSVKDANELLASKQGDISTLSTDETSSIVAALNEVDAKVKGIDLSSLIDDTTESADTTWSSAKIVAEMDAAVQKVIGGAPEALDTLKELAAAFNDNPDIINNIMTIIGNVVRVDIAQTFTSEQKERGRTNIGAASATDVTQLATNVGPIDELTMSVYTDPRDGVAA